MKHHYPNFTILKGFVPMHNLFGGKGKMGIAQIEQLLDVDEFL
jgi:hypothetical protein